MESAKLSVEADILLVSSLLEESYSGMSQE